MARLRLKEYLEENQIAKNEFARRLEVNPPVVRRFIQPDYDPKLSTLTKWAEALECTVSDLLDDSNYKKRKRK